MNFVDRNPPINDAEGPIYSFDMPALSNVLRNLQEKNRSLPFFNFGILKYEVCSTTSIFQEIKPICSLFSLRSNIQVFQVFQFLLHHNGREHLKAYRCRSIIVSIVQRFLRRFEWSMIQSFSLQTSLTD